MPVFFRGINGLGGACVLVVCLSLVSHAANLRADTPHTINGVTSVPILLTPNAGDNVASLQFRLPFDTSRFSVSHVDPGGAASQAGKDAVYAEHNGSATIIVAGLNQDGMSGGVVATVYLTALGSTQFPNGLGIDSTVFSDPDGNPVAFNELNTKGDPTSTDSNPETGPLPTPGDTTTTPPPTNSPPPTTDAPTPTATGNNPVYPGYGAGGTYPSGLSASESDGGVAGGGYPSVANSASSGIPGAPGNIAGRGPSINGSGAISGGSESSGIGGPSTSYVPGGGTSTPARYYKNNGRPSTPIAPHDGTTGAGEAPVPGRAVAGRQKLARELSTPGIDNSPGLSKDGMLAARPAGNAMKSEIDAPISNTPFILIALVLIALAGGGTYWWRNARARR